MPASVHCVCYECSESTYKASEAYTISPGHDSWVVGDEPAVVYEFGGMWGEYAETRQHAIGMGLGQRLGPFILATKSARFSLSLRALR